MIVKCAEKAEFFIYLLTVLFFWGGGGACQLTSSTPEAPLSEVRAFYDLFGFGVVCFFFCLFVVFFRVLFLLVTTPTRKIVPRAL